MIETATTFLNDGKKSLNALLREKAYVDVTAKLKENGIDINEVSDEDIETLVAAKVEDMNNGIKGFATGTAFALVLSMVTGF